MDERLRALERAFKESGDPTDELTYLQELPWLVAPVLSVGFCTVLAALWTCCRKPLREEAPASSSAGAPEDAV